MPQANKQSECFDFRPRLQGRRRAQSKKIPRLGDQEGVRSRPSTELTDRREGWKACFRAVRKPDQKLARASAAAEARARSSIAVSP